MILIIAIGLIFLHAISKGICDRIKFKANFKSDWMLGIGEHIWYKRTWLTKHIFSFVADGWHASDTVRCLVFCFVVAILYSARIDIWNLLITNYLEILTTTVVFYIIHGLIFEIIYNS